MRSSSLLPSSSGGSMIEGSGSRKGGASMLLLSLLGNVALLVLLALSTIQQPPMDPRLEAETSNLRTQRGTALDLRRITEHVERVNKQLEENLGLMGTAKLSLSEALLLESIRGVPAAETAKILQTVKSGQGTAASGLANTTAAICGQQQGSAAAAGSHSSAAPRDNGGEVKSSSSAGSSGLPWLTIGVPTVPRNSSHDYLTRTIETLLDEMPMDTTDPLYGQIKIVVMNMAGRSHTSFDGLNKRFEVSILGDFHAQKARVYVSMQDAPSPCVDPTPDAPEPDPNNNPEDRPGRTARKQSCDILNLLKAADRASRYFMFMEDDFETCPHALYHLHYALRKLNSQQQGRHWLGLRVSYGMNGVLVRGEDMHRFAEFSAEHITRKPIDLLWQEFSLHNTEHTAILTRGRDQYTYRYNLFVHTGDVSTFTDRPPRGRWPQCFDLMTRAWSLQDSEKFDKNCLDVSDFSPCAQELVPKKLDTRKGEAPPRWLRARLTRPEIRG